ncbi:MAG: UspA protein [Deltaproteobacteria bacterium]|nr:UspA protein [Deltaproteobacteria bacterium]
MYKNIVVPLDGSALAECVLSHVEALARGCLVKEIIFVRAVEPFLYPSYAGEVTITPKEIAQINTENKLAAADYLEQLAGRCKYENVHIGWEVLYGRPAETIADYSAKHQADLMLIATHGRSGVSRWVWGSVADRILRSACVPVLMVRAPGCFPGI